MRVGVVDVGAGNIFSVIKGLKSVNIFPFIINRKEEVKKYSHIILPGVAAFKTGSKFLKGSGINEEILLHASKGKPLLGLCLGCQLLMEKSFEFGEHEGLGLIEGDVKMIPKGKNKVPHVGWRPLKKFNSWKNTVLEDLENEKEYVYFTHSFVCIPSKKENYLATFNYGEKDFVAAIHKENIFGLQFHPELSGTIGRKILKKFKEI